MKAILLMCAPAPGLRCRATPGTLAAPTGLTADAGDQKLSLSWTAPTGTVTGYEVHYTSSATVGDHAEKGATDVSKYWVEADPEHTGVGTSHEIRALTNDRLYRVRVRAKSTAGNGAWAFSSGTPAVALAAPEFDPEDGETTTDADTNITLTFAKAIKKDSMGNDFSGHSDLDNILLLKKNDNNGDAIAYTASIDTAKKVITIDPTASLDDGDVYVYITVGYYTAEGDQGVSASATFTVDATAPSPKFSPADTDTVTDAGTNITLTFAEAIRKDGSGTALTNADLAGILTLKETDDNGNAITFSAEIDSEKKVITIDPTQDLADGAVYVAISNGYYDVAGNQGETANATFTVDATPPSPTFSPANDAVTKNVSDNITLTFEEAIYKDADSTALGDGDLSSILTLKSDNSGGNDITYSAEINSAKTVITIDPSSNLAEGAVYVAISDAYYDAAGNQGSAQSATFTVDTTPPSPDFSPGNGGCDEQCIGQHHADLCRGDPQGRDRHCLDQFRSVFDPDAEDDR